MKTKTAVSILLLGALPALGFAAGDHAGGHDMSQMGHGSRDMHGPSQEMHAAAAGRPGDPAKVGRTLEIKADDTMRFIPDRVQVKAGETVRFIVGNAGKLQHELVIGSLAELREHAAAMRTQPNMKHDEPNAISVGPGQTASIVWRFDRAGTVDFACLVPGHFEVGMSGKIDVTPGTR